MTLLQRLIRWFKDPRRELRRRARQTLDALFTQHVDLLRGTSLRVEHRSRTQVIDVVESPYQVLFGIVRHPRPYPFSRQYHEVLELWRYDVERGELERLKGLNLSRLRGDDDDAPSSYGAGV